MNSAILELAELGIEHREAADIDCTAEREALAAARTGIDSGGMAATASEVVSGAEREMIVAYYESKDRAYRQSKAWQKRGFVTRTEYKIGRYRLYAK